MSNSMEDAGKADAGNDRVMNTFTFPPPTETELRIRKALILAGNRDIQKPHDLFAAAVKRLAAQLCRNREDGCSVDPEWRNWLSYVTRDDPSPENRVISDQLRGLRNLFPDRTYGWSGFLIIRKTWDTEDREFVSSWNLNTAERLFHELKMSIRKDFDEIEWHLFCLDAYESFCLNYRLFFYQFPDLYTVHLRYVPDFCRYELARRFSAYALRYPTEFTGTFETILALVKPYSRPLCDVRPFTGDDPLLEKRINLCSSVALTVMEHRSLNDPQVQRELFSLLNEDLLQDGDRTGRDAAESVFRALCTRYGAEADPAAYPPRNTSPYTGWNMDDARQYHLRQEERMSRIIPFIDAVSFVRRDEFAADVQAYFQKIYPFNGANRFGLCLTDEVSLAEAAEAIIIIAQRYMQKETAARFIRSILDTVVHESSPGETVLDAIADTCRTYAYRSPESAADETEVTILSQLIARYFPACREDAALKTILQKHLLQQAAVHRFTREFPSAYHILTEQNAADILTELRVNAKQESLRFVQIRIYTRLCIRDRMPPYLAGECLPEDDSDVY